MVKKTVLAIGTYVRAEVKQQQCGWEQSTCVPHWVGSAQEEAGRNHWEITPDHALVTCLFPARHLHRENGSRASEVLNTNKYFPYICYMILSHATHAPTHSITKSHRHQPGLVIFFSFKMMVCERGGIFLWGIFGTVLGIPSCFTPWRLIESQT